VELRGSGVPPAQPLLHVGSVATAVHLRPLDAGFARLRLDRPLPLRHGDRAVLRDPGDRRLWGVRVLDPDPPALRRRGAAARRAEQLTGLDGSLASALRVRGHARRSELTRLGFVDDGAQVVAAGDWLLSPELVPPLSARLRQAVEAAAEGLTVAAAAHLLGLPDPALVDPLVTDPVHRLDGRLTLQRGTAPADDAALAALRSELAEDPFAAPDAPRLAELGVDDAALVRLARAGLLVRLGPGLALLPEAVAEALARLARLPQPFTASEARQALRTSRRVALPLLAHLDRSGGTVRLPDDRRRLRRPAPVPASDGAD
jgi:selenocysteine-specific elongation factor